MLRRLAAEALKARQVAEITAGQEADQELVDGALSAVEAALELKPNEVDKLTPSLVDQDNSLVVLTDEQDEISVAARLTGDDWVLTVVRLVDDQWTGVGEPVVDLAELGERISGTS